MTSFKQTPMIGIFGSAKDQDVQRFPQAYEVGELLIQGFNLLTGSCPGLPKEACRGAYAGRKQDSSHRIIGISPFSDEEEHVRRGMTTDYVDHIIYTGLGTTLTGKEAYASRNGVNARSVQGGIILPGSEGTLLEARLCMELNKPLAVMSGLDAEFEEKIRAMDEEYVRRSWSDDLSPGYNRLFMAKSPESVLRHFGNLLLPPDAGDL